MFQDEVRRYSFFISLEMAVVVGIIAIFRLIEDRPTAASVAGALFLFSTLFVMGVEWRQARKATWAFIGACVFLLFSVLPVLLIRVMTWGEPFETAEVWGLRGGLIHKISNYVFLIYLVGIFISLQQARQRKKALQRR